MAKKLKQNDKIISLAEFNAWLSGIEDLQPSDWSPDKAQWKLIRAKIKLVECSTYSFNNKEEFEYQYGHMGPPKNRSLADQHFTPVPMATSEPLIPPHDFTPAIQTDVLGRPFNGNNIGGLVHTAAGTLKTPDIRTDGNYTTSFE